MKKFLKWFGIVIAALIIIPIIIALISIAIDGPQGKQSNNIELTQAEKDSIALVVTQKKVIEIKKQIAYLKDYTWSANNLLAQYESNEIKADGMFKNKAVTIIGRIKNIGSDIVGDPYIIIGNYNYSSVQCVFPKSAKSILQNLQKGQSVLLKGTCQGKFMNVVFKNCEFLKNITQLKQELKKLK